MKILRNKSGYFEIEMLIVVSLIVFVFGLYAFVYYESYKKQQSIVNTETKIVELTIVDTKYIPRSSSVRMIGRVPSVHSHTGKHIVTFDYDGVLTC